MTNHTDPVCGMKLDEKDAAGMDEYKGKTYFFDGEDCMVLFRENPEKYAKKADKEDD